MSNRRAYQYVHVWNSGVMWHAVVQTGLFTYAEPSATFTRKAAIRKALRQHGQRLTLEAARAEVKA